MERVILSDGQLASPQDLSAISANVDLFLQILLGQLLGDTEALGVYGFTADVVPGATDVSGATVPTLGFIGPALRVTRVDATHVRVNPGLGLVHRTANVPAGEDFHRVVYMSPSAPEFLTGCNVAPLLPSAGNFKRVLVTTAWRDVNVTSPVSYMDTAGNVSDQVMTVRRRPEVGSVDTVVSGINFVPGSAAASATLAARPAVPSGHVVLAELLLSDAGLTNTANPDNLTPGITDLRPRARISKAAGAVDSRRATCSMDEAAALRSVRRIGAKAVGAEEVFGLFQMPTGALGVVTLDTSRDWRDGLVEVMFTAAADLSHVPGGLDDVDWRRSLRETSDAVPAPAAGIELAMFYSGIGSPDGSLSSDPTSGSLRTAADDPSTFLVFFADLTTGALKCRCFASLSAHREVTFVAKYRGPLGRRPSPGVEA